MANNSVEAYALKLCQTAERGGVTPELLGRMGNRLDLAFARSQAVNRPKNHEHVAIHDGREPVSNDHRTRVTRKKLVNARLYGSLRLSIKRARCFIDDHEPGLLHGGGSNHETLRLTARKLHSRAADTRVEAIHEASTEVDTKLLNDGPDLLVSHRGTLLLGKSVEEIVANGTAKHLGALSDVAERAAPGVEVRLREASPVDLDAATGGVAVPLEQLDERALASARPTDECDLLADRDIE